VVKGVKYLPSYPPRTTHGKAGPPYCPLHCMSNLVLSEGAAGDLVKLINKRVNNT